MSPSRHLSTLLDRMPLFSIVIVAGISATRVFTGNRLTVGFDYQHYETMVFRNKVNAIDEVNPTADW